MNKKQKELALKVADLVEDNWQYFDMATWVDGELTLGEDKRVYEAKCNSAACLAGFVVLASQGKLSCRTGYIKGMASDLLGLDIYEACEVFEEPLHEDSDDLDDDLENFPNTKEYARAAAQRMRDLVKNNS